MNWIENSVNGDEPPTSDSCSVTYQSSFYSDKSQAGKGKQTDSFCLHGKTCNFPRDYFKLKFTFSRLGRLMANGSRRFQFNLAKITKIQGEPYLKLISDDVGWVFCLYHWLGQSEYKNDSFEASLLIICSFELIWKQTNHIMLPVRLKKALSLSCQFWTDSPRRENGELTHKGRKRLISKLLQRSI